MLTGVSYMESSALGKATSKKHSLLPCRNSRSAPPSWRQTRSLACAKTLTWIQMRSSSSTCKCTEQRSSTENSPGEAERVSRRAGDLVGREPEPRPGGRAAPPRLRLPGDGGHHCHPANVASRPLTLARPAASGKPRRPPGPARAKYMSCGFDREHSMSPNTVELANSRPRGVTGRRRCGFYMWNTAMSAALYAPLPWARAGAAARHGTASSLRVMATLGTTTRRPYTTAGSTRPHP